MRSHHVAIGLLLLLVAGALGVSTLRHRQSDRHEIQPGVFRGSEVDSNRRVHQQIAAGNLAAHPAHLHRVEPQPPAKAGDLAQARQTEAGARRRLEELTTQLGLSANQQDKIFPLLVRSSPHYDESLRLAGSERHPGTPLSRLAADEALHGLLDPYQQVEFELAGAERDLWWSDVISRLEQDLNDSTQPDTLPAVGNEAPAPNHGGGNLFDLLNEETP
jgi:hypothetical protein